MRISIGVCLLLLALVACSAPADSADDTVVPQDSIFMGYWFGMPRDSFYTHSWNLNRQGLVRNGPQNQNIQYNMDSTLAYQATMLFYPDFFEEKIARMRVRFRYDAWAPWNKHLFADSLIQEVVRLMTEWHGEGFESKQVIGPYGSPTLQYTKEDRQRRIEIGVMDDLEVGVIFTDKEAEQRMIAATRDAAQ